MNWWRTLAIAALTATIVSAQPAFKPLEPLWTQRYFGNNDAITAAAIGRDGTRLVTGDDSGQITVWDTKTSIALSGWSQSAGALRKLEVSADGETIVGLSAKGVLGAWELETGRQKAAWPFASAVDDFEVSPNGAWVVVRPTGQDFYLGANSVSLCTLAPSCQTIASASSAPLEQVVAFNNDSSAVYIAGSRQTFELSLVTRRTDWQGQNMTPSADRNAIPSSIALSPDGRRLLRASRDGLELLDATSSEVTDALLTSDLERVLRWSDDGSAFATLGSGAVISVWDAKTLAVTAVVDGSEVLDLGAEFITTLWDTAILRWDTRTGIEHDRLIPDPQNRSKITLGGHHVYTTDGTRLILTDARTRQSSTFDGGFAPRDVRVSPDGQRMAITGSNDVRLLETKNGGELQRFPNTLWDAYGSAWSPNGQQLATQGLILEVSSGRRVMVFDGYATEKKLFPKRPMLDFGSGLRGRERSIAWSPDGKQIAIGYEARGVGVWDASSGTLVQRLIGHTNWVLAVAWRPDGRQLASSDGSGNLRFWNPTRSALGITRKASRSFVRAIAYSPDGRTLASTSEEGAITLWDTSNLEPIKRLEGHTSASTALAWSGDGQQLVSGSRDQSIRIWDVASAQTVQTITTHEGTVLSLDITKNGERLLAVTRGSSLRTWGHPDGLSSFGVGR